MSETKDGLTYRFKKHEADDTPAQYIWSVRGPDGGVHIWAQIHTEVGRQISGEDFYGGVECHWPKQQYGSEPEKPHNYPCWLLEGPCYHDGSSLYFSENIAPVLRRVGLDNAEAFINSELHSWYCNNIAARTEGGADNG